MNPGLAHSEAIHHSAYCSSGLILGALDSLFLPPSQMMTVMTLTAHTHLVLGSGLSSSSVLMDSGLTTALYTFYHWSHFADGETKAQRG